MAGSGQKLLPLEGLRGIAALVVLLYHLVLGFTQKGVGTVPRGHGALDPLLQFGLGLLNGGAAVAVFFVLSGFILSLPFARDRSLTRILSATVKRWPRLGLLTLIACLFAFALISWSGHDYKAAAHIIGAKWMATHGNAPIGQHPTWWDAAREGLIGVFTQGTIKFDSPLWTMRIELFCSFAIFVTAPILFALSSWWLRLALVAAGVYLSGTQFPETYFSDFLAGAVLAMLHAENRLPALTNRQAALFGLLAFYLFSFTFEQKLLIHAPIRALLPQGGDTGHFVWDAAAMLTILLLLGHEGLRKFFSGRWAVWLGLLSFPIYLLHGPIMLSVGATSFLAGKDSLGVTGSAMMAALLSLTLTFLCALPLVWVDRIWTRFLRRGISLRPQYP